jgi:hypothetical protein
MFVEVMLAYQRHHGSSSSSISELTAHHSQHQVRAAPAVVIDQPDIFTAVLAPAEKEGNIQ